LKPRKAKPRNQCGACGEDFAGISLFDRHRVGKHAFDFSPEHPDGRRCLTADEMTALGWERDTQRDLWRDPASAARTSARFTP